MLLLAVAEDIDPSELEKLPELLRQEGLTILFVLGLSPDLRYEYPEIDPEFLTPSLVVNTDTSSNNLLLPQGTLFPEMDSKWTAPGLK